MGDFPNRDHVKKWCVKDVSEYFSQVGFSENVVNKLQEDEIDGETLLLLTDSDIGKMGLKTGPTVKLRNLIQNLKELPCSVHPANTSECYPCVESRQEKQSNDSNDLMLSTTNTNSLDDFIIMDIMNANVVGEAIVKSFTARSKKYITHRERQDVVRIAVDHIVKLKEGCYQSTQTKEKMAKAIVTTFPCLGSVIEPEDTISQPHHLYFNPQFGGFLETRLKAVRNLLLKQKNCL